MLHGAALLATRPKMTRSIRDMIPFLAPVAIVCLLVVMEPDLGTAMVACFTAVALLVAAGARLRHLALLGLAVGLAIVVAILIEPYRMARLTGFLDPAADPAGAGFQATQAQIALGSGGFFGVGLGESLQKAFYLPEAHTDMIAAVIGEELGLVGIVGLAGLFGLFAYAGLRTAQRARDRYGKLLAAGLVSLVMVQATINLFAVLGLAPLTGVPLPFVSYGNSSLLTMLAAVGLLLNVAERRAWPRPPGPSPRPAPRRSGRPRPRDASPPRRGRRVALADCRVVEGRARPEPRRRAEEELVHRAKGRDSRGGNRGHVVPALAVADALRAEGAEVFFLGARGRLEDELVPAAGYELELLDVRGLDRGNPLRAAGAAALAARAVPAARRLLRERGAEAVMGGGGYVAGPAGLAALRLGLPLVLTEADRHLGLANRLLARRARRVCLAFAIPGRRGRALRRHGKAGAGLDPGGRPAARRASASGSRHGSAACSCSAAARERARSTSRLSTPSPRRTPPHATTTSSTSWGIATTPSRASASRRGRRLATAPRVRAEPGRRPGGVRPRLARSGGSIFELAAAGRPAILVPYPHAAGDHQRANAEWMAEAGAAIVIDDGELDRRPPRVRRRRSAGRREATAGDGVRVGVARAAGRRRARRVRDPLGVRVSLEMEGRSLHFIAIGGAGMSGLALVCHELGAGVTGSDRAQSSYLQRVVAAGIDARIGHDAQAVPPDAEVVVSTAIGDDNPELRIARERGQRVRHRGELLAELCARKRLIAVAGTHGKTTTAGMLAHALRALGADPAFVLGGELPGAGPHGEPASAGWGAGEWIVAEADESDASFLELRPEVAVVTNVELDHHSRWRSTPQLLDAFRRFAEPATGLALLADPALDGVAGSQRVLRFGARLVPATGRPRSGTGGSRPRRRA